MNKALEAPPPLPPDIVEDAKSPKLVNELAIPCASVTAVGWITGIVPKNPNFCVVAVPICVPVVEPTTKLPPS